MSLSSNERAKIDSALRLAFPDYDDLARMLKFKLDWNLQEFASARLTLGTVVLKLIEAAEARDRVLDLVAAAYETVSSNLLRAIYEQLKETAAKQKAIEAYAPGDCCDACIVHQLRPFINRREFRRNLSRMNQENGPRVLSVNGTSGLGKSHSLHLISYVLTRTDNSRLGEINLNITAEKRIDPGSLVRLLSRQFKFEPKDGLLKQAAQDAWWTFELANWLVTETVDSKTNCWIVLDGFEHPAVPDATHEFIKHLLQLSVKSVRLRVILLDFSDDRIPSEMIPYMLFEKLTEITETELRQFISDVFAQRGHAGGDDAPKVADKIWNKVKHLQGKPEFTRKLTEAVLEELKHKFGDGGGV